MNKIIQAFSLDNRKKWAWPYILFMAIFVVLPLLLIIYYSLIDAEGHFTLRNFEKFFLQTESVNTLVYSIGIAMLTTLETTATVERSIATPEEMLNFIN